MRVSARPPAVAVRLVQSATTSCQARSIHTLTPVNPRWPTAPGGAWPMWRPADEPTGALDSAGAAEVLDLFAALHQAGSTVLMITHDPNVAGRAQRRLVLDAGRLTAAA